MKGAETSYTGAYKADLKHGQGEYKWASGNSYSGGFIDD